MILIAIFTVIHKALKFVKGFFGGGEGFRELLKWCQEIWGVLPGKVQSNKSEVQLQEPKDEVLVSASDEKQSGLP